MCNLLSVYIQNLILSVWFFLGSCCNRCCCYILKVSVTINVISEKQHNILEDFSKHIFFTISDCRKQELLCKVSAEQKKNVLSVFVCWKSSRTPFSKSKCNVRSLSPNSIFILSAILHSYPGFHSIRSLFLILSLSSLSFCMSFNSCKE